MASYIVEFKQADMSGFIHTKKTYLDASQAVSQAWAAVENKQEFEYLIIRKVKMGNAVTGKPKETK